MFLLASRKQKICPICNNYNEIKLELEGGTDGAIFVIVVNCKTCDYRFYFGLITISLIMLGIILAIPTIIILFGFFYTLFNGYPIIAGLTATFIGILIPDFLLIFFIRNSIFDNFINKKIIKKAEKMIIKGSKQDFWGNSYKKSDLYKYSPETKKISLK